MTKDELQRYIPPQWRPGTATYKAVEAHFLQGVPINQAAREHGIHRVTLAQAVRRMLDSMEVEGWRSKYVRRVVYFKV